MGGDVMKGRYVTRNNGAYDVGCAREIRFGDYSRKTPDPQSSTPPSTIVMERGAHRLQRAKFGGAYYDVSGHEWWYLGKFSSERAAIVSWETHLRQIGVIG